MEIRLHESLHMSIIVPVMKVRIDEERERRLSKEELRNRLGICMQEVDGERDDEVDM